MGAVHAASLPSGCPGWWPPGPGGRSGSCNGWRTSPWPWVGPRAPAQPWPGRGRQPSHPAARAPPAAAPVLRHPHRPRRGRFRPAETPDLWHGPDRSGAPPARGAPPGSHRRDPGPVAPGASWGGGDRPGSVESLCRRRTARGPRGHPGRGPLSSAAESRRKPWTRCSPRMATPSTPSMPRCASSPCRCPMGRSRCPCHPHDTPRAAQQRAAQRQARRQALYEQVWALHRQGWTGPAIAQQVGMSLRTVQRDLQTATFPGRKRRSDLRAECAQSL